MQTFLYYLARGLVFVQRCLPLSWLARLGRAAGWIFWQANARHRRVAMENLQLCFGNEKSTSEMRALARENFCRIGETFLCWSKIAAMDAVQLRRCLEVVGLEKLTGSADKPPRNRVVALGHFGNFVAFAHGSKYMSGWQQITTYRGLNQAGLDRLLVEQLRGTGCVPFERRHDVALLRATLGGERVMLGLLADQSAGSTGLWLPFFGRECSTSRAPALMALRYDMSLHTAICYRIGLAHWRIEVGDEIPTVDGSQNRSPADIMLDVNRVFEHAIRRDPANWFWVHRRWKNRQSKKTA
jgi:Kdo2-lipid IVA lauroyltransferase/acyltransferase